MAWTGREERICKLCTSGKVEDEIHFVKQCKSLLEDWKQLI